MATRSTQSLKSEIEAAVAEAKTAVEGGDTDDDQGQGRSARPGRDEARPGDLREGPGRAAASPGAEGAAARRGGRRGDEEVVDAEFSEVDEDNKG